MSDAVVETRSLRLARGLLDILSWALLSAAKGSILQGENQKEKKLYSSSLHSGFRCFEVAEKTTASSPYCSPSRVRASGSCSGGLEKEEDQLSWRTS